MTNNKKKNNKDNDDINILGVNECTICETGRKLGYPFKAKKFTDLL